MIDTATNLVTRTINLGLPIGVPGQGPAYGAAPDSIAVDDAKGVAYVALYNANAIAVINLGEDECVLGMIPVAYAPAFVVLDKTQNELLVANDKGIGTRNSFETHYGVTDYNSHQDDGTVSIIPVPRSETLEAMTRQVYQNNHWDLSEKFARPLVATPMPGPRYPRENWRSVADQACLPDHPGKPHLRSDARRRGGRQRRCLAGRLRRQRLAQRTRPRPALPAVRQLLRPQPPVGGRAPVDHRRLRSLLRRHPVARLESQLCGGKRRRCALYQNKGFLFSEAEKAGLRVKLYGEYVENDTFVQPDGSTSEPSWSDFYNDALAFEAGQEAPCTTRTRSRRTPRCPRCRTTWSRTSRSLTWASLTSSASICGSRTSIRISPPAPCLR